MSSPPKPTFLIAPAKGTPLCMILQAEQIGCVTTTLEEHTSGRSETEKVPQSADCLASAQQQTEEVIIKCRFLILLI